jgi:hypothetical protein
MTPPWQVQPHCDEPRPGSSYTSPCSVSFVLFTQWICLREFVYTMDLFTRLIGTRCAKPSRSCSVSFVLFPSFCFLRSVYAMDLFARWICLRDGLVHAAPSPRAPVLSPSFCFLSGLPALDIIRV